MFEGSVRWFHALAFIEKIDEVLNPGKESRYQTHPSANQRLERIIKEFDIPSNLNTANLHESMNWASSLSEYISKDIELNYDNYDFYGSVYLDKPNTKWRGRELIDRKDY